MFATPESVVVPVTPSSSDNEIVPATNALHHAVRRNPARAVKEGVSYQEEDEEIDEFSKFYNVVCRLNLTLIRL